MKKLLFIYNVHAGKGLLKSRLAAVLESPSRRLQADLESLNGLDHVRQLDVAYVNYEEDLDGQGHMACPPHRARGHRRRVSVPEGEPS